MPVLPLKHPEPFAATLGVMLYSGTDNENRRKALAGQMAELSAFSRDKLWAAVLS
jgi:hypothetical protein